MYLRVESISGEVWVCYVAWWQVYGVDTAYVLAISSHDVLAFFSEVLMSDLFGGFGLFPWMTGWD